MGLIGMRRILTLLFSAFLALTAGTLMATPSYAGRSACSSGMVCAWNNAGWTGTMAMFDPSAIYQATPAHCQNIDRTSSQDAISSIASYNGAPGFQFTFYKDANCYVAGGYLIIYGTNQIKDLKGTGFNDTFSSVEAACC